MKQPPETPAVEARDIVAAWGKRRVLDGVSLAVKRGEIVVIMGGSGSGKTTLLRQLLGLNRPQSGWVRLFGKDPNRLGTRALHRLRRRIGMAFQGGALFNSMTVGENVALPLREHTRLNEEQIHEIVASKLAQVAMEGTESLMPSELSGGMLKRAALARAIVLDPPLLFLDEPTAGLDPKVATEMDELIVRLREALGSTIVVVTHALESTFHIADRVLILEGGKIIFAGDLDAFRQSEDTRVQQLLQRCAGEAPERALSARLSGTAYGSSE